LGERQGTPWRVASPAQGQTDKQSSTLTLTPRANLESPFNLTCIFGRKPEYLERKHTYTGITCKLHTERPHPGFKPGTLNDANHYTTM